MKPGDIAEVAVWLTGAETDAELHHWKTVVCLRIFAEAERRHHVELGPPTFNTKDVMDDRVPPVPDHVKGPNVRLLVAEAKVHKTRPQYTIRPQSGFVEDLTKQDRARLRRITRRAHARTHPGDRLTDRHCDQIIEALGPETAVKTLRENHGRTLH